MVPWDVILALLFLIVGVIGVISIFFKPTIMSTSGVPLQGSAYLAAYLATVIISLLFGAIGVYLLYVALAA